jgi:outer membrane protein OmpU
MESDGFSEADGEEALRGEVTYGNVTAQLSYVLGNNAGTRNAVEEMNQLSLAVSADFGNFNVVAAYQAESDEAAGFFSSGDDGVNGPDGLTGDADGGGTIGVDETGVLGDEADNGTTIGHGDNGDFTDNEVFGLSVGTSFSGADIRLAYAEDANSESIGVQVAYPFGPVTATVYYVSENTPGNNDDNYGLTLAYENGPIAAKFDYDNDQGTDKYGIEGSYNVGNGVTVYAGYLFFDGLVEEDAFYVAGSYDLGSGAEFLVSYAEGDDGEYEDEIGANDYQAGVTAELSFAF